MGKHFTKAERNELSILLKKGFSHREIADALGKDRSSITREISRNKVKGVYGPRLAQEKSRRRRMAAKYQNMKVNESPEFVSFLTEKLKEGWTPEQITGRWNYQRPLGKHFSFKAVYKYLYSNFGQRLCKYLLSKKVRSQEKER